MSLALYELHFELCVSWYREFDPLSPWNFCPTGKNVAKIYINKLLVHFLKKFHCTPLPRTKSRMGLPLRDSLIELHSDKNFKYICQWEDHWDFKCVNVRYGKEREWKIDFDVKKDGHLYSPFHYRNMINYFISLPKILKWRPLIKTYTTISYLNSRDVAKILRCL